MKRDGLRECSRVCMRKNTICKEAGCRLRRSLGGILCKNKTNRN